MSNEKIIVRKATSEDSESIVLLTIELGYNATKDEINKRLSKISLSTEDEVFIAEYENNVAGWMHISAVEPLESSPFIEIRGLVVSKNLRKKGIGTKLINMAEDWAIEKGIRRLRVRTNIIREETREYYRNLNFIPRKTQEVFEKEI